jgi:hypothetical protein
MVCSDVLRCVLHNIVCPCWFWPWYCLTFFDVFCYYGQNQQGQTMLYETHRRTSDNTMAKTNKDKQCYTSITLFVLVGFGHGIVWRSSMYFVYHCLSLLVLAMVLSDVLWCILYNIVCPCWFWPWYCLTFLTIPWPKPTRKTMLYKTHRRTSDNTMAKTNKDKQCYTKYIEERQTIPWPKPGYGIVWRSSMCFI